jgi:peptide methionine sulfoxide reductase msrA/msrB
MSDAKEADKSDLKKRLTPLQYEVTQCSATEGYGEFVSLFSGAGVDAGSNVDAGLATETVVLAGGCFWGMQEIVRKIPGVTHTEVGYSGGRTEGATYETVKQGTTGHAEAVLVKFDPKQVSYETLLGYFFRMHDPTTPNRQGNDVGTQYRSAIFFKSEAERLVAERVKAAVEKSGKWKRRVATEIVAAGPFYRAEAFHQDYLKRNPGGYTCHYLRD